MATDNLIKKFVEEKHQRDLHVVGMAEDGTPTVRWIGLITPELEEITKVKRAATSFYRISKTSVTNLAPVMFSGVEAGDRVARTAIFEFADSTEPLEVSFVFSNGIATMADTDGLFMINAGDLEMTVFK